MLQKIVFGCIRQGLCHPLGLFAAAEGGRRVVPCRVDNALVCILQHCLVCKAWVLWWFFLVTHRFGHTKSTIQSGARILCGWCGKVQWAESNWALLSAHLTLWGLCQLEAQQEKPLAGMLCSPMEKAPHGLGLCGSPWKSAGLGSLLELPTPVVSGTCMARSPLDPQELVPSQRDREGKGGGLGPSRSPEDKRLLIAMATNKPCVVIALLSPWKRTEYHIATCASRTHGNGPVALQHPLLDLCSGKWWWGLSRGEPTAAGRWGWAGTGRRVPRAAANQGLHGNQARKVPWGGPAGRCQSDEDLEGACYPVFVFFMKTK